MRVAAVRCGTCETVATKASWRSGERVTTSAPKDVTTSRTIANSLSSVSSVGVNTQFALANMVAEAPSTPSCSEPAIG